MIPVTTVLEETKLPQGKLKLTQDLYSNGVRFVTAYFVFSKNERKQDKTLPLVISITDFHAHNAKEAVIKHIARLIKKD